MKIKLIKDEDFLRNVTDKLYEETKENFEKE